MGRVSVVPDACRECAIPDRFSIGTKAPWKPVLRPLFRSYTAASRSHAWTWEVSPLAGKKKGTKKKSGTKPKKK